MGLVTAALLESVLRFFIANRKEFDGFSKTFIDSMIPRLMSESGSRLSKWKEGFEHRINKAVDDSLKTSCVDENEYARIREELEALLNSVSGAALPLESFRSEESLFQALKERYKERESLASDRENHNFYKVLRAVTPQLLKEKENDAGYMYELLQECLKIILQIQQGTEELMKQFDKLWEKWEAEREKPELPEQKFYRLWEKAWQANRYGSGKDTDACEQLLAFLNEQIDKGTFDDLCVSLPDQAAEGKEPIPEFMCIGESTRLPLFYAQVLVWLGGAYAKREKNKNRMIIDRHLANKWLEQAEKIIEVCRADSSINEEEEKECRVFCNRCIDDIANAKQELTEEEEKELGQIPAVRVNRDEDETAVFEPVFGGCFDSVAGQDGKNLDDLELNIFQLAAGGKTILLQGPQIVDNRSMLQLLHKKEFDLLCKRGIIVFSSYADLKTTNDFIINRLNNPDFKFSSFPEYDRPGIGPALRKTVADGLNRHLAFREIEGRVPLELRERLELIYDGYWIADECFCEKDTLKYHQNPALRSGKFRLSPRESEELIQGIPCVLHRKLEQLSEDEKLVPIKGRAELLRRFTELERRAQTPGQEGGICKNRSDYEHMIDSLEKTGEYDRTVLDMFRRLVHICYLLYNGKLSCDKVIIPMTDPELCIHHRNQELQQSIFRVDYAYRRYKRMSTAEQNVIGWGNIAECVLNARGVMSDPSVPPERKALMMHKATGLVYTTALDHTTNVTGMSAKTSCGRQTDVSDRAFNDAPACQGDTQECY